MNPASMKNMKRKPPTKPILCSNCGRNAYSDLHDRCMNCGHEGYSITLWAHVQGKPLPNQPKG